MNNVLLVICILIAGFGVPVIVSIWIFGIRRYIHKKSGTTITAASWGLSMWADWTVAWEIGRKEGKQSLSAIAFIILHIIALIGIIIGFAQ